MITGLKPYASMKDSGTSWLGCVPTHWDVRRLKYVLQECDMRSAHGSEQLLRVSQYTGVTERKGLDGVDAADSRAQSLVGYKCVEPHDLVVNIMLAWNGSLGVSAFAGIASPAYCVYRFAPTVQPWYFHYLLRSPGYKARIKVMSTGVVDSRLRLYSDGLYRLEALLPPVLEQAAIVRFLDHADRRIRRFIRSKLQLIKLLEEQRQAVIRRLVTRGLDPSVSLKDSGVAWLGQIPENWMALPLRRVTVSRCDGPFGSGLTSAHYTDAGIRVVRLQNIGNGSFRSSDEAYILETHYETLGDHNVNAGDVLIAGLGDSRYPAGRACVAPEAIDRAMVKADCFRFRVNPSRVLPDFLALQLTATANDASGVLATGATRQRINLQSMSSRHVALPTLGEQNHIVASVAEVDVPLKAAIDAAEHEIALVREYRSRLIADVVTGKLDVRTAAASLSAEPDVGAEEEAEIEDVVSGDVSDEGEPVLGEVEA